MGWTDAKYSEPPSVEVVLEQDLNILQVADMKTTQSSRWIIC